MTALAGPLAQLTVECLLEYCHLLQFADEQVHVRFLLDLVQHLLEVISLHGSLFLLLLCFDNASLKFLESVMSASISISMGRNSDVGIADSTFAPIKI